MRLSRGLNLASGTPEIQGASDVAHLAQGSQDSAKNSWHKPWLCVCRKHTFLHRSFFWRAIWIDLRQWPDLLLKKVLEESPHGTVARANAANCVAEMAQNNPYCQENFLTDRFLPLLLTLMEKDPEERVRLKCLYAISSIVRDYPPGMTTQRLIALRSDWNLGSSWKSK